MRTMIKVFAFLAFAVFLTVLGCERIDKMQQDKALEEQPKAEGATAKEGGPMVGVANLVITTDQGPASFAIEIAQSDEERARGLMGRETLPENSGMFFVFPQTVQEKFWMKDTKIPLDLIYMDEVVIDPEISKPGKIVHVIENAVPESTELLLSPVQFRYVLEVNGGQVAKHGIKVGNPVERRVGP